MVANAAALRSTTVNQLAFTRTSPSLLTTNSPISRFSPCTATIAARVPLGKRPCKYRAQATTALSKLCGVCACAESGINTANSIKINDKEITRIYAPSLTQNITARITLRRHKLYQP